MSIILKSQKIVFTHIKKSSQVYNHSTTLLNIYVENFSPPYIKTPSF